MPWVTKKKVQSRICPERFVYSCLMREMKPILRICTVYSLVKGGISYRPHVENEYSSCLFVLKKKNQDEF